MVLRYAHHQPESLRGGAEVLDRLRRENSTKLAQWGGVNPSDETPELAHSCWPNVLSSPLHSLRVSAFCWLKKLYGRGAGWID